MDGRELLSYDRNDGQEPHTKSGLLVKKAKSYRIMSLIFLYPINKLIS